MEYKMATTKNLTIHIDDKPVKIKLKAARKADGILRAELMTKAINGDQSPRSQVAFFLYPTCIAAVAEPQEVREMSLDDFINNVDEADIDKWLALAYELNPQWQTTMQALAAIGEEAEKKISESSSGLMQRMGDLTPAPETSQPLKN
jgi:hypothetical protein